ncbi:unnamed protein product, partial [Ectocarpus sp. 12 AP-2014]
VPSTRNSAVEQYRLTISKVPRVIINAPACSVSYLHLTSARFLLGGRSARFHNSILCLLRGLPSHVNGAQSIEDPSTVLFRPKFSPHLQTEDAHTCHRHATYKRSDDRQ